MVLAWARALKKLETRLGGDFPSTRYRGARDMVGNLSVPVKIMYCRYLMAWMNQKMSL